MVFPQRNRIEKAPAFPISTVDRESISFPKMPSLVGICLITHPGSAFVSRSCERQRWVGKLFFNILATFAEFEADLIRMRTREGMAVARLKGKLRGKKPKLSERQQKELRRMYDTDNYSIEGSRRGVLNFPTDRLQDAWTPTRYACDKGGMILPRSFHWGLLTGKATLHVMTLPCVRLPRAEIACGRDSAICQRSPRSGAAD